MGKSISYCYKCSSLLREDDFEKGKAFQDGDRVVCIKCAPQLRGTRVTKKSTTLLKTSTPSRKIPVVPAETAPADPPAPRSKLPLILGASGGVAVIVVVLILVLSGKNEPAAPPPPEEKVETGLEVKKEKPKPPPATPDQDLLKAARKYAAEHADDLAGQVKEYEKLVWGEFEKTVPAAEARKEIEAIKAKIAQRVVAALAEIETELDEPLKREAFGLAMKKLEEAGGRLDLTEWSLALSKRSREIFDRARGLNAGLVAKVEALAAEGKSKEVQEIVKRVRGWELPVLVGKIEEAAGPALTAKAEDAVKPAVPATAALPVETQPRSEEGKAYLAKWEQAMAKVAARDYAAALDDLARAGAPLKEADVAAESKADVEDVKRLQALVKGAIEETVAKPAPWMSLELRDGRKLGGRVLLVDADRAHLAGKETAFAEWSEVTAASIAALPRKEKPEPRLLALFCLSEGELEAGKALLGAGLDAVPPKYWAWSPGAKAKIPRAEGIELSARDLFYAAEREYASMKTRGLAADKYRSLRKDYLASQVVKHAIDRIERRGDACREYYFAGADCERSGTLKLTKAGKLESDADSDENFANQNWAEIEFYVLPGATYRAWVQAGGCCQQVFSFLWQATELTAMSQKTKKPASADVGANLAPEIRPTIRGLKPAHDAKTPKAPTRWEWVELPLPKYSGPGPKRVRIMTDQKGFAIGAMVVSSSRKAPPKDDELKELEKARVAEVPPLRVDPDLVAWFTLDEASGAAVEDVAGGHKGTVNGKASWVAGKVGGALDLDGQTYVEVGSAEDLKLTGDISMAFWMNKKAAGGDWQRMVGKGDAQLRSYGCWVGGGGEKVLFQQYSDAAQAVVSFTTQKEVQIGKWHHFAATVQGTRVLLYLDGVKDGEGTRTGAPAKSDQPLLLGWGTIHEKFKGSLDDVRIYKRALSPEEVRDLFELGK